MSLRHRTVNGRSEICLAASEYLTLLDQYGLIGRESLNPTETLPAKQTQLQLDTGVVGSSRVLRDTPAMTLDEYDQEMFEEKIAMLVFNDGLSQQEAEREAQIWLQGIQARAHNPKAEGESHEN